MDVLGRDAGPDAGPVATVGTYRARDGSAGVAVGIDIDRPHVGVIVGKRGYGKSYTLGVLAEELARVPALAPVVIDPMGVFDTLAELPGPAVHVRRRPRISADTIPPAGWCALLGVDPASPAGSVLWQAVDTASTIAAMRSAIARIDAAPAACRAADNYLGLAASWGVFDPDGLDATTLTSSDLIVLDCSHLPDPAINAVGYAVADALYGARVRGEISCLPWILIDEAHALFDGAAEPALNRLVTRGRQPGVSLVAATQRPAALPPVVTSQADLLVAHRLTATPDRDRLEAIAPTYMGGSFSTRMPEAPGEVLVVDDVTERVHRIAIRERHTPHGGDSPRATTAVPPADSRSPSHAGSNGSQDT